MKILLFIVSVILLTSCEKVIRFDGTNSLIVVNSLICPDSLIKINLSKSIDLSIKDTVLHLDNAVIKIFCNDTLKEEIRNKGEGVYLSSFKPQHNKNYKIKVESENFATVISKTTIPEKPTIISVVADSSCYDFLYTPRVQLTIKDNPNIKNYYCLSLKQFVYEIDYSINERPVVLGFKDLYFICNDNAIMGKSNSTSKETIDAILGDSGGVGYNAMQCMAFSDNTFNGSTYTIEFFIFRPDVVQKIFYPINVYLKSISEEYYNYLKSREYISRAGTNPLSNLVRVSNNIEGGAGIFGSYNSVRDSITTIFPAPKK